VNAPRNWYGAVLKLLSSKLSGVAEIA